MPFPNYDNPVLEYRDLRRLAVASALVEARRAIAAVDLSDISPPPVRNGLELAFSRLIAEFDVKIIEVANITNITPRVWNDE